MQWPNKREMAFIIEHKMAAPAILWFGEDFQFDPSRKPKLNHVQHYFWMRLEYQCSKFKLEFRLHSFNLLGECSHFLILKTVSLEVVDTTVSFKRNALWINWLPLQTRVYVNDAGGVIFDHENRNGALGTLLPSKLCKWSALQISSYYARSWLTNPWNALRLDFSRSLDWGQRSQFYAPAIHQLYLAIGVFQ